MEHPFWPLFDLEISTPTLVLRYPDDATLVELAALAANGIHDPDVMPFAIPWSRAESPTLEREALKFHWRTRAETTPDSFRLPLAVFRNGELVGSSDLFATEFGVLRQFETGSWLGREFQGRGIGKEMRLATLAFGFDGLGATLATTGAWVDNAASLGVTRSLGYRRQGVRRANREGTATDLHGFEMDRDHFDTIRPEGITIHGIDAVRDFLEIPAST